MKKIKFCVVLAAVLAMVGALPVMAGGGKQSAADFTSTIAWNGEYDVIVVGFGGAGAVSSITAADEGASVLLLEKAPKGHHGGNTRVAAQFILDFTDFQSGFDYLKALRGGFATTSYEELTYLVKGLMANDEWLTKMGAKSLIDVAYPEYPELAGSKGVRFTMVESETLFDNFNSKYWQLLERNVFERKNKINVWYSSPAKHLIQDPISKTILGVQIEKDGKLLNIRAKNGVVLACGGFENNQLMIQNYNQRPVVFPIGTPYNTGDGINMVLEVGADLWHMSATSGPFLSYFGLGNKEQVLFDMMLQNVLSNGFSANPKGEGRYVVKTAFNVGPDGKRFANEGIQSRHGFVNYNGVYRPQLAVTPMYVIFDEAARTSGHIHPSFSADNSAEIAGGLIIQANTIAELARKIGYDPAVLENTTNEFNAIARSGKDTAFNRPAESMAPLAATGPYYALELLPGYVNTQGGARRNVNCEVLNPSGNPIPHLYSAGEFGSFYPDQYNAGGNLGETMVTGRTAGANAAKAKAPIPGLSFKSVKSSLEYTLNSVVEKEASFVLGSGEYLGEGRGMGGTLTLKVKMDGSKIAAVEILSHAETPGISDTALQSIPAAIIKAQSTQVDVVSGASMTSRAIIQGVDQALSKAK
jgi:uncharacterized protein with FMN-binding domain